MDTSIRKHVTVLGVLYIGMGLVSLLVALIVFVILVGTGLVSADRDAIRILLTVGTGISCFMSLFALPGVVVGIGLLMHKSWARILALILAVFKLFNIPIGTAVGIYAFWILMQDEAEGLFGEDESPTSNPDGESDS